MILSEQLRSEASALSKWGNPEAVTMGRAADELDRRAAKIKRLQGDGATRVHGIYPRVHDISESIKILSVKSEEDGVRAGDGLPVGCVIIKPEPEFEINRMKAFAAMLFGVALAAVFAGLYEAYMRYSFIS